MGTSENYEKVKSCCTNSEETLLKRGNIYYITLKDLIETAVKNGSKSPAEMKNRGNS